MFAHVLDHYIFSSKRFSDKTKAIVFGVIASIIIFTFWWFSGVAFGIEGPIAEHTGLRWRKVGYFFLPSSEVITDDTKSLYDRPGTSTTIEPRPLLRIT